VATPYPIATIPQLGTLFFGGLVNGESVWKQPGGAGTTVYPQQQPGEQVAMFVMPYCGHWTNNFEVRFNAFNPPSMIMNYVVPSAFCLCPLCGCVVRILTPASLYLDDTANYILLP